MKNFFKTLLSFRNLALACGALTALSLTGCDIDSIGEFLLDTPSVVSTKLVNSIVYQQGGGVWIIGADGTGAKELTTNGSAPSLSPDGGEVVFIRGTSELWTMDSDGSNAAKLFTSTTFISAPTWSPDSSTIAFVQNFQPKQVYTIGADAATTHAAPVKITGVKIVKENGRFFAQNVVNGTGGTIGMQETILPSNAADNFDPTFTPDGTAIAFVSNRVTIVPEGEQQQGALNDNEIYQVRLSDKAETRITDKAAETATVGTLKYPVPGTLSAPCYSKDGKFMVFATTRASSVGGTYRLTVSRGNAGRGANASGFFRLSTSNLDSHPVFSPDGTQIALSRSGVVYTRPNDSVAEGARALKQLTAGDLPSWSVVHKDTLGYAITGRVLTDTDFPIPNATLTLSGGAKGTNTDSPDTGYYDFVNLVPGNYTVSVSAPGYNFAQSSHSVTIVADTVHSIDFTGALKTFAVQGFLLDANSSGINGVVVTLSGNSQTQTATSANGGFYKFAAVTPGSYTLTVSTTQHAFSPSTLHVTVTNADVKDNTTFKVPPVAPKTFSISGSISGTAISGGFATTNLTLFQGTNQVKQLQVSANSYTLNGVAPGTYTLAATNPGYTFTPTSHSVMVTSANVTGENFAATPVTSGSTLTAEPNPNLIATVVHRSKIGADITAGVVDAGDHDADGDGDSKPDGVIEGFCTFDMTGVPAKAKISSAVVSFEQNPTSFQGDPYGAHGSDVSLGNVYLESTHFASINGSGTDPLGLNTLDEGATVSNSAILLSSNGADGSKIADVTAFVQAAINNSSSKAQFLLRFGSLSNHNGNVDYADFTPGELVIHYTAGTGPAGTVSISDPANGAKLTPDDNSTLEQLGIFGGTSGISGITGVSVELQSYASANATTPNGFYNWTTKAFVSTSSAQTHTAAHSSNSFVTFSAANGSSDKFPELAPGGTFAIAATATDGSNHTTIGTSRFSLLGSNAGILAKIPITGAVAAAVNEKTNKAYILRGTGVDVIDGNSNQVTASINFTDQTDDSVIAVDSSTNRVYVAGFGSMHVIDGLLNKEVTPSTDMHNEFGATGIAINSDPDHNASTGDSRIYVATGSSVDVFDGATNALLKRVTTSSEPYDLGVNTATDKVYAGIFGIDTTTGGVQVIDGATNAITASIAGEHDTVGIGVDNSANRVYVASRTTQTVRVLNGATNKWLGQIGVDNQTEFVAVNSVTGRVYLDGARVIDGKTNKYLGSYSLGSDHFANGSQAVNATTNRIYFVSSFNNSVIVVDGTVAPSLPPGS